MTQSSAKIEEPSLKVRAAKAVKWSSTASFVQKIISTIVTIILARILSPTEFGLFALAFVVIDGFGLFKSMGFDTALVQRKKDVDKAANTVFFIVPLLGIALYLLMLLTLPIITSIYDEAPELPGVLRALGLFFIIFTFSKVPQALLDKELKFQYKAIADIVSQVIYSVVALLMAFKGFGVWSLVYGYLLMTLTKCFMLWHYAQWKPNFRFDKQIALEMFHFGKFVFISSVLWFILRNFDKMVIGKVLGIAELGLYAIAFNLANMTSQYLGAKISEVFFPAYAKLQDNIQSLQRAYLKVTKFIALIAFPTTFGLFFIGGEFLELAYGQKWLGAIPVLKILAWFGLVNTLTAPNGSIFWGINKPKVGFIVNCIKAIFIFGLLYPAGKYYNVSGIAWVVVFANTISFLFGVICVRKAIRFNWNHYLESLKSPIIGCVFMSICFVVSRQILNHYSIDILPSFLIMGICATAVYGGVLYLLEKSFLIEIKNLVVKS